MDYAIVITKIENICRYTVNNKKNPDKLFFR